MKKWLLLSVVALLAIPIGCPQRLDPPTTKPGKPGGPGAGDGLRPGILPNIIQASGTLAAAFIGAIVGALAVYGLRLRESDRTKRHEAYGQLRSLLQALGHLQYSLNEAKIGHAVAWALWRLDKFDPNSPQNKVLESWAALQQKLMTENRQHLSDFCRTLAHIRILFKNHENIVDLSSEILRTKIAEDMTDKPSDNKNAQELVAWEAQKRGDCLDAVRRSIALHKTARLANAIDAQLTRHGGDSERASAEDNSSLDS